MGYEFKDTFSNTNKYKEAMNDDNYYKDPTEVEPMPIALTNGKKDDYSIKLARWIRQKMYGKHVRESLARFVEWISILANQMQDSVNTNSKRQSELETKQNTIQVSFNKLLADTTKRISDFILDFNRRYDEQIAGNTDLNEVIDARGGELTLNKRLSKMQHLLDSGIEYVTYSMFGVDSRTKYFNPNDGSYYIDENFENKYIIDDGIKIKEAHEFASKNNLPIKVSGGHYVIDGTYRIPITTNVDFGEATFHVKEDGNRWWGNIFEITGDDQLEISTDILELPIKKGIKTINELKDYEGCFVIIEDESNIVMKRSNNSIIHHQKEFFFVEKDGELISETKRDILNVTKIKAKKANKNFLEITGGTFLFDGNFETSLKGAVSGFYIDRSRVKISNQFVGIEADDKSIGQYSGFYRPNEVYDFELNNIRFIPRSNENKATYGLTGETVLGYKLNNLVAIGGKDNWGVMGSNHIKNAEVINCELSRFDVHHDAWDIKIENSVLGGINLSGGGMLNVINTVVKNNIFISFRGDYGAKWDGDIFIFQSKLCIDKDGTGAILSFQASPNHDFGTELVFGNNIYVKNFNVDYQSNNEADFFLFSRVGSTIINPIFMPTNASFENIQLNREKGAIFMNTIGPVLNNYSKTENEIRSIEANDINVSPNALWSFTNVDTSYVIGAPNEERKHLVLWSSDSPYNYEKNHYIPHIIINNCKGVSIWSNNVISKLSIRESVINTINSNGFLNILIENCEIKPGYDASPREDRNDTALKLEGNQLALINVIIYPTYHKSKKNLGYTIGKNGLFTNNWSSRQYSVIPGKFLGVSFTPEIIDYLNREGMGAYKTNQLLEHFRLSPIKAEYQETFY